jgi:N,N'-diacetyllegionaminate synthase
MILNDKNRVYLIAEVGQAHDGSLGILHSYIDCISKTGVDGIKFQMHIARAESSDNEPFRVNFSYEDETRFDYWKRMEFTFEQWQGIKNHCDNVGLDFICSPFSNLAVDWLERLDVKAYKIGSGEVGNLLLLDKIQKTGREIILSSGMSDFHELDMVFNFLTLPKRKISVLQCTTKYPTLSVDIGLNVIQELADRYGVLTGLSDHSGKIYPSVAAVSLGAQILEFHVVFNRNMFGPDSKSSLLIEEVVELVNSVRFIEEVIKNPIDKNNIESKDLKNAFGKTLAVNKSLKKGEVITFNDLESKKPANQGIPAADYMNIVGKSLNKSLKKWDFLTREDVSE